MRTKAPDPSTVRSTVIRLRVTEAEVELFKRKAREAGCKSVSEYIRLKCEYFMLRKALNRTKESTISLHGKHQRATRKALAIQIINCA